MDMLFRLAARYKTRLALISLLSVASSIAVLAVPWLAGQFVSEVLGGLGEVSSRFGGILPLLVLTLAALAASTIAVTIASESLTGRILADLRLEVYSHIVSLSPAFHDETSDADLFSLMTNEVSSLTNFMTATLAQLPAMIVTALGAAILLLFLNPLLALMVPALIPLFFIGLKVIGRKQRVLAKRRRDAEVDVITKASNAVEMIEAIKSFAVEERHRHDYRAAAEKARELSLKQARVSAFVGPISALIAALAAIAILAYGGSQLTDQESSPGDLFAFLLYAALLTRPVGELASAYGQFQIARGALARLREVLGEAPEVGYSSGCDVGRAKGAIAFENVTFAYPGRPQLFDKLELKIAPGEIIALTGQNGIGKSTLVRLLLRYYEPSEGRITLDGADIASLQIQEARRQFGYVPQRPLLFDGTVLENITFGEADADPVEVERAARMAQAWDFIQLLPQGLETVIGDDGLRLSGGQRQRIALARALLRDPPIYIFDEATSMYDLEGEAAFIEACIRSLKDRTVIIITHRPASLALADRVIDASDLACSLPQAPEPLADPDGLLKGEP